MMCMMCSAYCSCSQLQRGDFIGKSKATASTVLPNYFSIDRPRLLQSCRAASSREVPTTFISKRRGGSKNLAGLRLERRLHMGMSKDTYLMIQIYVCSTSPESSRTGLWTWTLDSGLWTLFFSDGASIATYDRLDPFPYLRAHKRMGWTTQTDVWRHARRQTSRGEEQ